MSHLHEDVIAMLEKNNWMKKRYQKTKTQNKQTSKIFYLTPLPPMAVKLN